MTGLASSQTSFENGDSYADTPSADLVEARRHILSVFGVDPYQRVYDLEQLLGIERQLLKRGVNAVVSLTVKEYQPIRPGSADLIEVFDVESLGGSNHPYKTPRPVVYVNITGGVEQWTITAPGNGEPEVYIVDHDDEASLDDLDVLLRTQLAALDSLRGRIPEDVFQNLRIGIGSTRDRIAALEAEGFTRYQA